MMDLSTMKVFVCRDVVLKEKIFPFLLKISDFGNNVYDSRNTANETDNHDM